MVEGFWIVQFEGMTGNGGGVVMFIRGKVFGGDSGFTYIGSYSLQGTSLSAHVKVHQFLSDTPSVLGVTGDFELDIAGSIEGGVINGTGSLSAPQQTVGIALKLTKRAELPA